jgi:GntR family transcriptional regulator
MVIQLRDTLVELIRDEQLKPGEQIPTEHDLAARFSVSRATVREALKLLEQDGLVDVVHGRGRFVSANVGLSVNRPVTRFESVTEMLAGLGYITTNRTLSVERAAPTDEEAEALGVDAQGEIVRLRRLRLHEDSALVVSVSAFSTALLGTDEPADLDFTGSLAQWLAGRGHDLQSSAAQIQALPMPPELAALPEVDGEQAWLVISERCVDAAGRSVLFSREYHRGDVFTFHVLRRRGT